MNWILPATGTADHDRSRIGGKGYALARMSMHGFNIPQTLHVTSDAYHHYVSRTGLRERILLELHRKGLKDMRWEEIWDCATRIRNMFLRTPLPSELEAYLGEAIESCFKGRSVVVRSSAPEEDDTAASFAGLHETYLNIKETKAVLTYIRKVWASLWSDAALLYRHEIGLDVEKSAMAVVLQEIVVGDRSGVAFSRHPTNPSQAVIESVYGLNQGLVDGAVEPDRWVLDRQHQKIVEHTAAIRQHWLIPSQGGVLLAALPDEKSNRPPLEPSEVREVFDLALKAEAFFKTPQDVEWTIRGQSLYVLQSRPITAASSGNSGDQRGWYLSLHRSFDNLKMLRKKIEDHLIPDMISTAGNLAQVDLSRLSDQALAQEIDKRRQINQKWVDIYWKEFIPFAHGVRLFGQIYNDAICPEDPYEFIDLLTQTDLASLERNRMLEDLAGAIRHRPELADQLKETHYAEVSPDFRAKIENFMVKFGDLSCAVSGGKHCVQNFAALFKILLEMARHPPAKPLPRQSRNTEILKAKFLEAVGAEHQARSLELLDLARSSYRLRDDDNIHLGRIEAQLLAAIQEARQRLDLQSSRSNGAPVSAVLKNVIDDLDHRSQTDPVNEKTSDAFPRLKPRQLVGQPAGPGISRGKARVIHQHADLAEFKYGETLVCDAVDPNMTFIVPLASAVVERRGGMLIHGAIIAREYGLPCVTGIAEATALIKTGDELTVDGYLGMVTVGTGEI